MSDYACPDCYSTNTLAVWEDRNDWKSGSSPDTVVCRMCHIVEE